MAKVKSTEQPRNEISGCVYALMIFSLERIPSPARQIGVLDDRDTIIQFPFIVSWANTLRPITRNNWHNRNIDEFVEVLDNLQGHEIIWKPYERLLADFLPLPLRRHAILGMSRTILLCFEKALYHRPDLSPRQFGLEHNFECNLGPLLEIKILSRGEPKVDRDWSKFRCYVHYNEEWEKDTIY